MTSSDTAPIRPATTFVARGPEDVLAVVPVVLGFVPTDSVVMLTFGGPRPFHARVDLPRARDEIPDAVAALHGPAVRHRVARVVLVLYSADEEPAGSVAAALGRSLEGSGIDVVDCLRAGEGRWFPLLGMRPGTPATGVPYDVSHHPFAARAVVEGLVTHRSRDELAASVGADAVRVAELAAALEAAGEPVVASWQEEGDWVRGLVASHAGAGSVADDAELARLLPALRHLAVRDAAWGLLDRPNARDHVAFWTDVVRRTPVPLVPAPASLLAFAAWLAGHGALAWCALDRVFAVDPDYRMAGYLAQALEHALPPEVWEVG